MVKIVTLICTLLLATIAIPSSAQSTPIATSGWTVTDQLDVQVDGDPTSISPDGQWLAGPGKDGEIFCVWSIPDLDETCDQVDGRVSARTISWAPDSSAIAFADDPALYFVDSDIQIFDLETMTVINLTDDPEELQEPEPFNDDIPGSTLADTFPAWAADSRSISFVRGEFGRNVRSTKIMQVDLDSVDVSEVFTVSPNEWFTVYSRIFIEPDGSILITVLSPDQTGGQNAVWRIAADGSRIDLVFQLRDNYYPIIGITDLSADGSQAMLISAASTVEDSGDEAPYYLLDLESGDATPLADPVETSEEGEQIGLPHFVPGSTEIVFKSTDADGSSITIDLDLDEPTPLIENIDPNQISGGFEWSESNLILLRGDDGSATIYTVESGTSDATPLAPCSCSPPEEN